MNDLERFHRLTRVNPVKSLQELPRVITAWECELKEFQRKCKDFEIHDKIKIAVMLQLLPEAYAKDMRKEHNRNPRGYDSLRAGIFEYVQMETGHLPPMQIDALEYAHRCGPLSEQPREAEPYWTPECKPANELDEEVYYSEHEWVSWYSTLDEAGIAALGFQAKGKGKGRTQWTPAQMKQYENDECFVCGKGGHKARDCPDVKETKGKGKKGEKGKGKGKGGKGKGNYWRKGAGALDAEMPEAEGLTGGEDGGGRGCGGLACGSLELLGEFDIGMIQEVSNSPSNTGSEPDIDADSNFADQIETQNMINDRLNEAESSEDDDDGESDGNDEDQAITMTGAKFFDFTTTSSPKRYRAIDPEPSQSSADVKAGRQADSAGDPISLGATFAAAADLAAEAAHDRAETGLGAAFAAAAAKSVATAAAHESVAGQTSDLGESRVEPVDVSPGTDQASSLGEALGFSRRPVVVANHESESAPSRVANHRSGPSLSDAFLIEQKKLGSSRCTSISPSKTSQLTRGRNKIHGRQEIRRSRPSRRCSQWPTCSSTSRRSCERYERQRFRAASSGRDLRLQDYTSKSRQHRA